MIQLFFRIFNYFIFFREIQFQQKQQTALSVLSPVKNSRQRYLYCYVKYI